MDVKNISINSSILDIALGTDILRMVEVYSPVSSGKTTIYFSFIEDCVEKATPMVEIRVLATYF
jgi:RecA/RadA recombinase